jgi:hypothetical protein
MNLVGVGVLIAASRRRVSVPELGGSP